MICWYKPCKRWTKGRGWSDRRRSLPERSQWLQPQRTPRCTGDKTGRTGKRQAAVITLQLNKVLSVTSSAARLLLMLHLHERLDKRPLTSLVLQMSPSVDPQALPGVAFHGIIPGAMKFMFTFIQNYYTA